MIAILLCAGFATRMVPLTAGFPKPLLPVAERPVLDYLVDQVAGLPDIEGIHLVTNAKFAAQFDRWRLSRLNQPDSRHLKIVIHNDGASTAENRLGACADLQLVFQRLSSTGPALVSAGDNIYLFGLQELWERFLSGKSHRIIALAEDNQENLKRSGVPVFGDNDRLMRLLEKPDHPPVGWICPPLYFLRPSARIVLDEFLKCCRPVDAPGYFIDYLCQKEPVVAFRLDARRLDIGSPESYRAADRLMRTSPPQVNPRHGRKGYAK